MATKRVRIIIRGAVQGVFFRRFIKEKADALFVRGWVRNTDAGDIAALFVGEEHAVVTLLAECRKGPEGSRIDSIHVEEDSGREDPIDFSVRYWAEEGERDSTRNR